MRNEGVKMAFCLFSGKFSSIHIQKRLCHLDQINSVGLLIEISVQPKVHIWNSMGKQLFHVQRRSVTTMLIDYLVLILKTVRYTECSKIEGTEAFMENLNTTSMRTTPHALFYSFSFIFFFL